MWAVFRAQTKPHFCTYSPSTLGRAAQSHSHLPRARNPREVGAKIWAASGPVQGLSLGPADRGSRCQHVGRFGAQITPNFGTYSP